MAKYKSSEEKLKVIIDFVIKIVEENCNLFEGRSGTHSNNIPRDRRILLRKKKKLYRKLRNTNSADTKSEIETVIGEIDKKLLVSHEENIIVKNLEGILRRM